MSGTPGHRPEHGGERAATLNAGRVGRAHGLDGSFYVTGARPRLLQAGTVVTVGGAVRRDRAARRHRRPPDRSPRRRRGPRRGRSAARRRAHRPAAEAPQLAEGEWWAHELEGCAVLDGGQTVGTVTRMLELPSCEVLEVARPGGGEPLLVPMVADAIRSVEPRQRRIEIDLAFLGLGEQLQDG